MRYHVTLGEREIGVDVVQQPGGGYDVKVDGVAVEVDVVPVGDGLSLRVNGHVVDLSFEGEPPELGIVASGHRAYVRAESDRMRAASAARGRSKGDADGLVKSPMPGRVVKLLVAKDSEVAEGAPLVVVEAMKMENELRAPRAGKIGDVFVKVGDTVEGGAKLLVIA